MNPAFGPRDRLGDPLPEAIRCALALLLEAWNYAAACQRDAWDFAVEIAHLRGYGLTHSDLRWLLCKGLAKHGIASKAVGWKDEVSQILRFDKLVQCLIPDDSDEPFGVNDVGSGYGAMFRYLDECFGKRLAHFHGYEISDAMIEACRAFVPADDRLEILNDREGVWRCRTTFNCTDACPRGIEVTKAIQEVKRALLYRRV